MGLKKEYRCYKGMEAEACCQQRVDEAVRNRTYLIALMVAIALMVIALVTKTVDDSAFVEQVSFASTITSIILSVIAIWMSITGERSTNEIRMKVSETVDKLTATTNNSMALSDELRETLTSQNIKYEEIKNKMAEVISNIEGVKSSVNLMNNMLGEFESDSKAKKSSLSSEDLEKFVNNIINSFNGKSGERAKGLMRKGMTFLYDETKKKQKVLPSQVLEHIQEDESDQVAVMIMGMLMVLYKNEVFEKVSKERFNL